MSWCPIMHFLLTELYESLSKCSPLFLMSFGTVIVILHRWDVVPSVYDCEVDVFGTVKDNQV